jgi:predicted membrane protein
MDDNKSIGWIIFLIISIVILVLFALAFIYHFLQKRKKRAKDDVFLNQNENMEINLGETD